MDRLLLRFMSVTPRYPLWARYLLSLGLVGLAFVAKLLLDDQLRPYPLVLFIPAIFLASVIFDRGSGFLATGERGAGGAIFYPSAAERRDPAAPHLPGERAMSCRGNGSLARSAPEALGGEGLRGRSHDGVGSPDQERPRDHHVDPPFAGAVGP